MKTQVWKGEAPKRRRPAALTVGLEGRRARPCRLRALTSRQTHGAGQGPPPGPYVNSGARFRTTVTRSRTGRGHAERPVQMRCPGLGGGGGGERGAHLRGGGLQQPGQAGEDADEEQGFFAVEVFLWAAE